MLILLSVVPGCLRAGAQTTSTALPNTVGSVQSLSGQTINAVSGLPIARVLVRYGGQALLTDYEGRFQFVVDGATTGSISANKPGYSMGDDGAPSSTLAFTPAPERPIEVLMYPEAILTGSVVAPNGDSIPNIQVMTYRSVNDEAGHHWLVGSAGRTNAHGVFRLTQPAGDYRLDTSYLGPSGSRKEAVLPVAVPEISSSSASSLLRLRSGETQHLDLHPAVRPIGSVTVRFEPESFQRSARITARAGNGTVLPIHQTAGERPGEANLAMPYGTYTLQARSQGRIHFDGVDAGRQQQGTDAMEEAETRVTVGEHEVGGVMLRFAPVNAIPVEMIVETGSTSDNATPPTISRLGLSLENVNAGSGDTDDPSVHVATRPDQTAAFSPPPGIYRLHAQGGGSWFVRAANYGTSDLLQQDLTVAAGAGTLPIRVVVSNQTAGLSGVVRENGVGVSAQIYLVASMPSATSMLMVKSGADGNYSRATLPPGTYRAIAFEHSHNIDFQDPGMIASLSNEMQSVTLNAGDKGTLDLTVTPFADSR